MKEIALEYPIIRGEKRIETITIHKPRGSGWLRGLKISELLQLDTATLATALTRVATPALTETEIIAKMDPADLVQLGGEVAGSLLPKSKLEEIAGQAEQTEESPTE
jgi:hypothetical protein